MFSISCTVHYIFRTLSYHFYKIKIDQSTKNVMNRTIVYYIESFFILNNLCFSCFLSSCQYLLMFSAVAIPLGCQTFQIWSFSVTDFHSPGVLFSLNFHTQVDSVVPLGIFFLTFTFKSFFNFFSIFFSIFFKIFTLLYHKFAISYEYATIRQHKITQ